MRILIVTEHYWPETFRINDLALGLRDRGHVLSVVAALPNYPGGRFFDGYGPRGPWRETVDGIVIHRVPVWPRGRGNAWDLALNYSSYVLAATGWLAVRNPRPDGILVFQPSPVTTILPAVLTRSRGTPVVSWVLDLWPDTLRSTGMLPSRSALRLIGAASGWLYRSCDMVLGQTPAYRRRFEEMGVPSERIGYLPSWAEDVYEKQQVAVPPQRAAWDGEFTVMFAGNLGKVQALDTVLDAAEMVRREGRRCHWVFVGDGSARNWLDDEVRRRNLGEFVHLVGRRPVAEMPAWYARASAMLVSLKADPVLAMTIPAKIQGYLAARAPILTSMDGEGARVVVESGAGFASPAGNASALADNTIRMMDLSLEVRARMGMAGRAYYDRNFSRAVALDYLEETFGRLIERSRQSRG